jgi:hypothetical protein
MDSLILFLTVSPLFIIWVLAIFFRDRRRWIFITYILSGITGLFYPLSFILSIFYSDSKPQSSQPSDEIGPLVGPLVIPIIVLVQIIIMPLLAMLVQVLFNYMYNPARTKRDNSTDIS